MNAFADEGVCADQNGGRSDSEVEGEAAGSHRGQGLGTHLPSSSSPSALTWPMRFPDRVLSPETMEYYR